MPAPSYQTQRKQIVDKVHSLIECSTVDSRSDESYLTKRTQIIEDLIRFHSDFNPVFRSWFEHKLQTQMYGDSNWQHRSIGIPISSFKYSMVGCITESIDAQTTSYEFISSGTTSADRSRHRMTSLDTYHRSIVRTLELFDIFGKLNRIVVQLHPSSATSPNNSLAYMFDTIRFATHNIDGGFFSDGEAIATRPATKVLQTAARSNAPVLLLTTSFALLQLLDDLADQSKNLHLTTNSIVVDTGGYKGAMRSVSRESLLELIRIRLGVPPEHCWNEYSMSEISSQAWSCDTSQGYLTPPWTIFRIVDPVTLQEVDDGEVGVIDIIDLANIDSCPFVRTQDIGRRIGASFSYVGRIPKAPLKGCSIAFDHAPSFRTDNL